MLNDNFRVWLLFAWCDCCVWYWLAACELTQPHSDQNLRFFGANFAYQIIIVWQYFSNDIWSIPSKICKKKFTSLLICFWLQNVNIIRLFHFWGLCFFIIIRFVFDISLHGISSDVLENHFRLLKDVLRDFWIWRGSFLWTNTQF